MPSSSNKAAYGGKTPLKPSHYYTTNASTNGPFDQRNLSSYRLGQYSSGPSSTPYGSIASSSGTQYGFSSAQERTNAELDAIIARLPR